MLDKVSNYFKSMFGGKTPTPLPTKAVETQETPVLSSAVVTYIKTQTDMDPALWLLKKCRTKYVNDNKKILLVQQNDSVYGAYQATYMFPNANQVNIALVDFAKNPDYAVSRPNKIYDYVSIDEVLNQLKSQENTVFVMNENTSNLQVFKEIFKEYKIIYYKDFQEKVELINDYMFFGNVNSGSGIHNALELYVQHPEKVLGWANNTSIFSRRLFQKPAKNVVADALDEGSLLLKMKNGTVDLNDMMMLLGQVGQMKGNPMLAMTGVQIPDNLITMMEKFAHILKSLTLKEKTLPKTINASVEKRLAKNGIDPTMIKQILTMWENFRGKAGMIADMANNPTKMMEMMRNMKK